MKTFIILLLVGILLVSMKRFDFSSEVFLLHGPALVAQANFFLMVFTTFLGVAALILRPMRSLSLAFCLSIYFALDYLIWFTVGNVLVPGDALPMRDGVFMMTQGIYYCMIHWDGQATREVLTACLLAFTYSGIVVGVTLGVRKAMQKTHTYFKSRMRRN